MGTKWDEWVDGPQIEDGGKENENTTPKNPAKKRRILGELKNTNNLEQEKEPKKKKKLEPEPKKKKQEPSRTVGNKGTWFIIKAGAPSGMNGLMVPRLMMVARKMKIARPRIRQRKEEYWEN